MSSNPKITRREVFSFRLKPLTNDAIRALAGQLSVSNAELIETAVDRMMTEVPASQTEAIKEARRHLSEVDKRLAKIERGQS